MIASSHNIHKTKTFSFVSSVVPKNDFEPAEEKLNELREKKEEKEEEEESEKMMEKETMTSEPLL